jgi:hypothetical protein
MRGAYCMVILSSCYEEWKNTNVDTIIYIKGAS